MPVEITETKRKAIEAKRRGMHKKITKFQNQVQAAIRKIYGRDITEFDVSIGFSGKDKIPLKISWKSGVL